MRWLYDGFLDYNVQRRKKIATLLHLLTLLISFCFHNVHHLTLLYIYLIYLMSFPLLVEVFCLFLTVEFPEPRIVPGKLTGTSDMYGMNE